MKKEIAKKWIRALRSGRYRQGKHVLKAKSRNGVVQHCCLGVLCELYQNDRKRKKKQRLDVDADWSSGGAYDLPDSTVIAAFDSDAVTLPERVRTWAGISEADGTFRDDTLVFYTGKDKTPCKGLAALNDNGWSFKRIADVIVKHVSKI